MKLKLIAVPVLLTLSACMPTSAGGMQTPVRVYEVDAWGSNPDIIEFIPKGYPNKRCLILVSGGDTSAGLQCFDKVEKDIQKELLEYLKRQNKYKREVKEKNYVD
ncbi:MAG: hypothetical protein GY928_17655 [Colwellia sp.]|nr:hypothetical protein [Colwellia sp.]